MPRCRKTYDMCDKDSKFCTPCPMLAPESPSELDTRVREKEGEESSDDDVTMQLIDAEKGYGDSHRYRVLWTDGGITWEEEKDVQGTIAFQYFLWEPVVCNLSDAFQKSSKKRPAPRPAQKKGVAKAVAKGVAKGASKYGLSTGKENSQSEECYVQISDLGIDHKSKKRKKRSGADKKICTEAPELARRGTRHI